MCNFSDAMRILASRIFNAMQCNAMQSNPCYVFHFSHGTQICIIICNERQISLGIYIYICIHLTEIDFDFETFDFKVLLLKMLESRIHLLTHRVEWNGFEMNSSRVAKGIGGPGEMR